jgi:hypothetical protein
MKQQKQWTKLAKQECKTQEVSLKRYKQRRIHEFQELQYYQKQVYLDCCWYEQIICIAQLKLCI